MRGDAAGRWQNPRRSRWRWRWRRRRRASGGDDERHNRHAHFWVPSCQIQIIYNINFSRIYFCCAENSINCDTIARLSKGGTERERRWGDDANVAVAEGDERRKLDARGARALSRNTSVAHEFCALNKLGRRRRQRMKLGLRRRRTVVR